MTIKNPLGFTLLEQHAHAETEPSIRRALKNKAHSDTQGTMFAREIGVIGGARDTIYPGA